MHAYSKSVDFKLVLSECNILRTYFRRLTLMTAIMPAMLPLLKIYYIKGQIFQTKFIYLA